MDFTLNDEQSMLADSVGRWLESDYDFARRRRLAAGEEGPDAIWREIADLGLLGLNVPDEHGGMGATSVEAMIVMRAFGRALVVEPYLQTAFVAAPLVARVGRPDQRERWLPGVVAGDERLVVATYEPEARFDLDHVDATATLEDGAYVLRGRKAVVIGAGEATGLIVSVRTAGQGRSEQGLSMFIVPANSAGLTIRSMPTIDGLRSAEVTLDAVSVDASAMLGPLHGGYEELERAVDRGTAALCAEAVGTMERLLEMTAEHLRTRRQFGQAIGNFQALQHRAADMAIAVEQARSMSLLAAARIDADDRRERRRAISAAKMIIGQSGRYVGEQAVHLHGGMGMTDDLPVGWYFKRLICIDLTHGDSDHHLELYGALL